MKKVVLIVLFAVLGLVTSSVSFAQTTGLSGFDAFTLRYPTDGSGTYTIAGSNALKQWQPHFGLNPAFSRHILSALRNNQKRWPINYAFSGNLVAAVGLFDFLAIGMEVPVIFYERVENISTLRDSNEFSFGDIRFDIKGRILEDKGWHPGIAFIPSVFIPTGNVNKFTGNTGVRYQGLLVVDKDFGPIYVSLNAGYRLVKWKRVLSRVIDDQLIFGLGVGVPLPIWGKSLEFIVEGNGATIVRKLSSNTTYMEVIGGLRKKFKNGLRVDVAGSAGVVKALGTPDFRVLAGIGYTMPKGRKKRVVPTISEIVEFGFDSYKVAPHYYDSLRNVGRDLINYRNLQVVVKGRTDSTGSAAYNQKLSEKRAKEVAKYLTYFGASKGQLETVGLGKVTTGWQTKEERAKSRSATIESK